MSILSVQLSVRIRRCGLALLAVSVLPLALACESDSLKPPPKVDDRSLYWDLELNHHAVTLGAAPHDTLTLVATPRNYEGQLLPGLPAPTYRSIDVERVLVTPEGMLIAVGPTAQPIQVIATLTTGNLKHEDTVLVHVVTDLSPLPVLASLSIHPLPPDSAKTGSGTNPTGNIGGVLPVLPVRAAESDGTSIPVFEIGASSGIAVVIRSADTSVAKIINDGRTVAARRPGPITFYASATAFGVTKTDTLQYQIGWPVFARINIADRADLGVVGAFDNPDFRVGVGATVLWELPNRITNDDNATVTYADFDVTFSADDLSGVVTPDLRYAPSDLTLYCSPDLAFFNFADCGGGNIALGGGSFVPAAGPPFVPLYGVRTFLAAGAYEYRSTRYGTQGRIVVVQE